ncbi:hypothetical protein LOAG_08557 [Loa loa]|uniref:Uncharacterized protein n=1 Tax=Loa loa TaxID=7209 RepID=A0A1S0TTR0_LOALO|nr:hypothetical protein LOAG_08557 [Loa loa]EFO19939.1 hypothetical protein LOAG_08557 [Loa loa]
MKMKNVEGDDGAKYITNDKCKISVEFSPADIKGYLRNCFYPTGKSINNDNSRRQDMSSSSAVYPSLTHPSILSYNLPTPSELQSLGPLDNPPSVMAITDFTSPMGHYSTVYLFFLD